MKTALNMTRKPVAMNPNPISSSTICRHRNEDVTRKAVLRGEEKQIQEEGHRNVCFLKITKRESNTSLAWLTFSQRFFETSMNIMVPSVQHNLTKLERSALGSRKGVERGSLRRSKAHIMTSGNKLERRIENQTFSPSYAQVWMNYRDLLSLRKFHRRVHWQRAAAWLLQTT